jgi:hypothetical protein
VESSGPTLGGLGACVHYKDGISAILQLDEPVCTAGADTKSSKVLAEAEQRQEAAPVQPPPSPYSLYVSRNLPKVDERVYIGKRTLFAYCPFVRDFGNMTMQKGVVPTLNNAGINGGFTPEGTGSDHIGSLCGFMRPNQFGFFLIDTHGGVFQDKRGRWNVYLMGGNILYSDLETEYEDDVKRGRLYIGPRLKQLEQPGRATGVDVMPSFIDHYAGKLPNSLVFIGACWSGFNASMAGVFLQHGAGAYFGFTTPASCGFITDCAEKLFTAFAVPDKELLQGCFIPGQRDPLWQPGGDEQAVFVMWALKNLKFPVSLGDGDFELNDLGANWGFSDTGLMENKPAAVRCIKDFGGVPPWEGQYMLMLAMEPRPNVILPQEISQAFYNGDKGNVIKFAACVYHRTTMLECYVGYPYVNTQVTHSPLTVSVKDTSDPLPNGSTITQSFDLWCTGPGYVSIPFLECTCAYSDMNSGYVSSWSLLSVHLPESFHNKMLRLTFGANPIGQLGEDFYCQDAFLIDGVRVVQF